MLDWITCVTTFQQIVETGSFSQTAKKQYTSPSAITKRINWLEEALNAPLFIRSTRKISITEAGQTLYERSLSLINEWDDIKQAVNIQHKEVTGTLRIGVPTGFGSQHLVSMLPKFLDQYPSVAVNLKLSNCVSQLADEEIDVYITRELSGKNNQKFHQQPVMEIHHKIYASPSYLKKQGTPKTLKDLEHHNCIKICYQNTYNWEFDAETLLIDGSLTTNNTIAGINAAIAGIGLVCLCPMSIKKEIKQGLLVPVLPEYQSRRKKIYAFYPKQNFIPKKTLAFIDHLKAHFLKDNHETDQKT